jgi:hypothetical protein
MVPSMKRHIILNSGDVGMIALCIGFVVAMIALAAVGFVAVVLACMWYPVSIGIAVSVYLLELAALCWRRAWE